MYYTGIGSRETPDEVMVIMEALSETLASSGYCLRSGGASGADTAFENKATAKEIYLPWNGFNRRFENGVEYIVPPIDLNLINEFHPQPDKLSTSGLKLMNRNSYQVLGRDLATSSSFVICWTKDGKASGGTGQAMRIAMSRNIPIYNLRNNVGACVDEILTRIGV